MALKDLVEDDLDNIFYNTDDPGVLSAIYTPKGKTASAAVIIVGESDPTLADPAVFGDSMRIRIRNSFYMAYGAGVRPQSGDSFVLNAETWYVIGIPRRSEDFLEWELEVTRSEKRILA